MSASKLIRDGRDHEVDELGDEVVIIYRNPDKDLCSIYRVPKRLEQSPCRKFSEVYAFDDRVARASKS